MVHYKEHVLEDLFVSQRLDQLLRVGAYLHLALQLLLQLSDLGLEQLDCLHLVIKNLVTQILLLRLHVVLRTFVNLIEKLFEGDTQLLSLMLELHLLGLIPLPELDPLKVALHVLVFEVLTNLDVLDLLNLIQ